jgi:hypothetical protein
MTMTETNPTEPSDAGKGGPIEFSEGLRDDSERTFVLWSITGRGSLNRQATPDDIIAALSANPELMAACADGLSRHTGELREQLTEAQAEIERVKAELNHASEAARLLRESLDPAHDGDAKATLRMAAEQQLWMAADAKRATPPSSPAAVEAKPAEQHDVARRLREERDHYRAIALGKGSEVRAGTMWHVNADRRIKLTVQSVADGVIRYQYADTGAVHELGRAPFLTVFSPVGAAPAPAQEQPASPMWAGGCAEGGDCGGAARLLRGLLGYRV